MSYDLADRFYRHAQLAHNHGCPDKAIHFLIHALFITDEYLASKI
jgi:hypothetical protein